MLDAIEIRRKGPKVSQAKLKITWSDFFCYILSLLSPPANQVWCDMGTAPLGGNLRLRDRQIFLVPIALLAPGISGCDARHLGYPRLLIRLCHDATLRVLSLA